MKLTKGKEVMIYDDYITETEPEGRGQLVECRGSESIETPQGKVYVQDWYVRFYAYDGYLDPTLYRRKIRVTH